MKSAQSVPAINIARNFPRAAARIRLMAGKSWSMGFEDYRREPALMYYWATYAQDFDIKITCHPWGEFPLMPRNEARRLARYWPEMAETVKERQDSALFLEPAMFKSDPELLWWVVWYSLSRRMPVVFPQPSLADRYFFLIPPTA